MLKTDGNSGWNFRALQVSYFVTALVLHRKWENLGLINISRPNIKKIYMIIATKYLLMENILIGYLVDHSLLTFTKNSKHKYFETYAAI